MCAEEEPKIGYRKIKKAGRQGLRKSLSAHPKSESQSRFRGVRNFQAVEFVRSLSATLLFSNSRFQCAGFSVA